MDRKVILAMVDGTLCIDPSDVGRVDIQSIKVKLKVKYGKDVPVKVAPIASWMTESSTETLMREAMDKMSTKGLKGLECTYTKPYVANNRHNRRAQEAKNRRKTSCH